MVTKKVAETGGIEAGMVVMVLGPGKGWEHPLKVRPFGDLVTQKVTLLIGAHGHLHHSSTLKGPKIRRSLSASTC